MSDAIPAAEKSPAHPPKRRRCRWPLRVTLALLLLAIAGELLARFYLGLGDPPLMQADAQIEYLFKPDQDCRRFGNRIQYNHYSMRSDDFPLHKTDPRELRVLVVGDSVVNGGVLTDQAQLATTLLQQKLAEHLKRPVVVGNISAGSWGPPNELAYLKHYGLFDADILVIVLSSHDYADVPTFEPVVGRNAGAPDRRPVLALWEGFERYLLPKLKGAPASYDVLAATTAPAKPADIDACISALREMIAMARSARAKVIVAQYLERKESLAAPLRGHEVIAQEAHRDGVTPIELGTVFEETRRRGEEPYRDDIHPSAAGQREIAAALAREIEAAVPSATAPSR